MISDAGAPEAILADSSWPHATGFTIRSGDSHHTRPMRQSVATTHAWSAACWGEHLKCTCTIPSPAGASRHFCDAHAFTLTRRDRDDDGMASPYAAHKCAMPTAAISLGYLGSDSLRNARATFAAMRPELSQLRLERRRDAMARLGAEPLPSRVSLLPAKQADDASTGAGSGLFQQRGAPTTPRLVMASH